MGGEPVQCTGSKYYEKNLVIYLAELFFLTVFIIFMKNVHNILKV